jgi:chemotaxis family two-component system response regulator Rcp1
MMNTRPVELLLVEDNPGDVDLTREALRESKIHLNLSVAVDGAEAVERLWRRGRHAEAPRPDLIVLDLNLPRIGGREVLSRLKADPELASIPVVVMTSSSAAEDVARSYALHANCFVSKPLDMEQFIKVVTSIENFWFSIVRLPEAS